MTGQPNGDQLKSMFEHIMLKLEQNGCEEPAIRPGSAFATEGPDGKDAANGQRKLSIFVLGKTHIEYGAIELGFCAQYDTERVICLLASRLGRPVHVDDVKQSLWPDLDTDRSEVRLIEAIAHLCDILDVCSDECPIERRKSQLKLRLGAGVWLDAMDLIEAAGSDDDERRRCALALYRDEPFADYPFEGWTLLPRELLRSKFIHLIRLEADSATSGGQSDRAVKLLEWALEAEPYDEDLYRAAITANIELGRFGTAVAHSRACRDQLANIGLAPSVKFETLERRLEPFDTAATQRQA